MHKVTVGVGTDPTDLSRWSGHVGVSRDSNNERRPVPRVALLQWPVVVSVSAS